MEFAINYQSKGRWHFADPVSGTHLACGPLDRSNSSLSQQSSWLLVNKKQRAYAMASSSGTQIRLKRGNWCFSTRQKLSFKYVAPTESVELSGTYTWKYEKMTKKYLLTKKGDPLRRVFATLVLDTHFPTKMPAKMQIFDKANVFAPDHALVSMDNELASKELDKFINLSILEMLLQEERKMSRCRRGNKKAEKAEAAAQTTGVMKCGCVCHCFPGKCTLTKFEEKLKDMFNVTVREVEPQEKDLSA
ncbi:hypothetical protein OCU04_001962 [Sclerotinia nivalis]|uniref:Uncharacterized protein n=1 Tax=Sclerotinia nivalis TaxID=352851 RepID=A0A9X0DRG6_9HELO|nr:hypothetical protein OCU04_001962 [Sclerotinia nivalis]